MSNKLICGTHHVAIKAANPAEFEKTLAFYRDVLELEVLRTWPGGAMLATGNSILELFDHGKELNGNGSLNHVALTCADVDAVVELVRSAGYKITTEPDDVVIPSEPPFPLRMAFFTGSAGESVELFCEK